MLGNRMNVCVQLSRTNNFQLSHQYLKESTFQYLGVIALWPNNIESLHIHCPNLRSASFQALDRKMCAKYL